MKISVLGGKNQFSEFLEKIPGHTVSRYQSLRLLLSDAEKLGADAIFILPDYESGALCLPEFFEEEMERLCKMISDTRVRIYIENYPSYDYRDLFVFGLQARGGLNSVGRFSLTLTEKYGKELGFDILQKKGGFYFRASKHSRAVADVICEIKNCIGVHKKIRESEECESMALMKNGERIWCAMADFTNIRDREIFSYKNWCAFYARVFSEILDTDAGLIKAAFEKTYAKIEITAEKIQKDRLRSLEDAVRRALSWHENSGIMLDSGRGGVYEMVRSFDLGIAKNKRGDSAMFTAALFAAAGEYFGEERYKAIARGITHHILEEKKLQIKDGENRGLFLWFSGIAELGSRTVYVSDTSRVGNSVIALYKLTGNSDLRESALSLADALLRWFDGNALLPICNFDCDLDDLTTIQKEERCAAPEFYDAPMIFLKNAYSITGNTRYRDQILKTADALASLYPDYRTVTSHSDNFTYSRLLGVFAVAESFESGSWTPVIDKILSYFEKLQHKTGGFIDGRAYYDEESLSRDIEFAVGFGQKDAAVADIVYCQNTLLYSLNILNSCASKNFDRARCKAMLDGLTDFLLRTQIDSPDKRLDGAWMRAFDMDNMEYYGCDKDFAWGPYCILTGWVTGAIPLVFLDVLGLKTIY